MQILITTLLVVAALAGCARYSPAVRDYPSASPAARESPSASPLDRSSSDCPGVYDQLARACISQ
jgi:hypothetical protein